MSEAFDSGVFERGVHRYPVRVWFEDTDLTGVAYHANYLRWMERARSAMLELCGIDQQADLDARQGYWTVADLAVAYKRPARMGDRLTVVSRVVRVRAAATVMTQDIWRDAAQLSAGTVTAAWLDAAGRPQRQRPAWAARFTALMHESTPA